MLKPDCVPDQEPDLRVGIVLPEDNFTRISLIIPNTPHYRLISETDKTDIEPDSQLDFNVIDKKLQITGLGSNTSWRIDPATTYSIKPQSGIIAKNIIAGRGFHWQKRIDVYLTGAIEIKMYQGKIILINELPIEEYLMCVATSEMGSDCPAALIEAQTIAARSWMLANIEQKHVELEMDVCNDDCCQRYQGSGNLTEHSIKGARDTKGEVLLHKEKICDARYSKSCGGMMESFQTIWAGPEPAYFKNIPDAPPNFSHPALPLSSEESVKKWIDDVPDSYCSSANVEETSLPKYLGNVDKKGTYFRWQLSYTQREITKLINQKTGISASGILDLIPLKRGGSGRLSSLEVHYRIKDGNDRSHKIDSEFKIRQTLHNGFLYSSCIYIKKNVTESEIPVSFTIKGGGWGHGVGLCQIGALGMALRGIPKQAILSHYYPGTVIKKIYK